MTERDGWELSSLLANLLLAALPQPSAPLRENQLHLPLAPLQNRGTCVQGDSLDTRRMARSLPPRASIAAARGVCLSGHQQQLRTALCKDTGRQRHPAKCCAGLEAGPIVPSIITRARPRDVAPTKLPYSSSLRTHCIVVRGVDASSGRHRPQVC